jgi:hypothetical protein
VLAVACARPPAPAAGRGPGGLTPIDPGTSAPELLSAASCAGCHATEHAEWRTSRHALAWTNGIFQHAYRQTPRAWCIHCHAPLAAQVAEAKAGGGPLADEGVGCASCHVRQGRIVAGRRGARSPHDTLVSDAFGGPGLCADCHQFDFPRIDDDGEVRATTAFPMQATVAQFHRGPYAAAPEGCRTCHLAHTFPGGHDPGMLAGALDLTVCRRADAVVVAVENRGAGHHVPTGDVHRHILVRLWRPSAPERLFEAFLGRRFTPEPGGGKSTTWDSTLAPRERRAWPVALADLGGEPNDHDEPVAWELRYVYVATETARRGPSEPTAQVVSDGRARFEELPPCAR